MKKNKQENKDIFNEMEIKRVKINLKNIITAFFIIGVCFFILTFINRRAEGRAISLTDFVSNLKNNKYSVVNIKDDGKVIAIGKGFVLSKSNEELPEASNAMQVIKDVEIINEEALFALIKPISYTETLSLVLKPSSISRADSLYIGDNFVLVGTIGKDNKHKVIYNFGADEFDLLLNKNGVSRDQLRVKIYEMSYQATSLDAKSFNDSLQGDKFVRVWDLSDFKIGELKEQDIIVENLYWNTASDDLNNFTQFLQKEGINFDSDNVQINIVKTVKIAWGDLIMAVFLGALIFISVFMLKGMQSSGGSLTKFGESKARMFFGKQPDVTFKDVAGINEAKEELKEIVLFLRDPKRFLAVGARIPKGALMVGAPGTGKTLLARAIAGEAGVPFFHTSGSEFEEMLVGAGASRVRDLFSKAKKAAPSLIFIDEIDAVARKRGTTIQSGTTEQTLNQILVEMDGFERNTNVIVIAATNRPDVLDPAILRPGRFDRRIVLDLPDLEGRKEIIKLHAKNKPIAKNVNLDTIAKRTVGFSGADIENMLNEAAILVAKENRTEITPLDLEEAATKVQIGPEKKRKRTEKELKMTAYHEAGHALVMKLLPDSNPVHRVTIISRGMALGYTMPLPENDRLQVTKSQMLSEIKSLLAGHATEQIVFNDVTSGGANDIERATEIAKKMVTQFGMSKKLGLVKYGDKEEPYLGYSYGEYKDYSEDTAKVIDEEVRGIMNECLADTKKIINENRAKLDEIVNILLEKETIEGEDFNKLFE